MSSLSFNSIPSFNTLSSEALTKLFQREPYEPEKEVSSSKDVEMEDPSQMDLEESENKYDAENTYIEDDLEELEFDDETLLGEESDYDVEAITDHEKSNKEESIRPSKYIKHDLNTPTRITKMKELRKRHFKECVTGSPIKDMVHLEYENAQVSLFVQEYKRKKEITAGRNVALLIAYDPRINDLIYVIDTTQGPPNTYHAELRAHDKLPEHVRVHGLKYVLLTYTEREPCPLCAAKYKLLSQGSPEHVKEQSCLNETANKAVMAFSATYSRDPKQRQKEEEEFQRQQRRAGIRVVRKLPPTPSSKPIEGKKRKAPQNSPEPLPAPRLYAMGNQTAMAASSSLQSFIKPEASFKERPITRNSARTLFSGSDSDDEMNGLMQGHIGSLQGSPK